MNNDEKNHALGPEQDALLNEILEKLERKNPLKEEELEPGKRYTKEEIRIRGVMITDNDPVTGEPLTPTPEQMKAGTLDENYTVYYPKLEVKWGEYLCDPGKGWTLDDYEHYEERMKEYAETGSVHTAWGRLRPDRGDRTPRLSRKRPARALRPLYRSPGRKPPGASGHGGRVRAGPAGRLPAEAVRD